MNTRTLTTRLITDTTTTIKENKNVDYFGQNRKGLANNYSVLGLIVGIETTKQRGWNLYETTITIGYTTHWGIPTGFSEWVKEYKTSLSINTNKFLINSTSVEHHTATKLQNTHDIGVIACEPYVLTIINKYIELLFNQVDKEVINRQINELQSQLATL